MTKITRNIENNKEAGYAMYALTLERARRRYGGEELPVTSEDIYQTELMIDITTSCLKGYTRIDVLANYFAIWLAESQPKNAQDQVLDVVMRCLRRSVNEAVKKGTSRHQPEKIEVEMDLDGDVRETFSPNDFALADKALGHSVRRYCGENLPVTQNDLLGTIALITQLMADVEIALVVDKLADAIVEECDGSPPDAVFEGIRSLVLRTIRNTDLLNSRSYRTLH